MSPEDVKKVVNDEHIKQLILKGVFICRIGSLVQNNSDVMYDAIAPSEPFGLISDIYKEDDTWYGDIVIPEIEGWMDLVSNMKDPILHPLVYVDSNGEFRIVLFAIMDRTDLDHNLTYDGIHHATSESVSVTSPMKLFRIEISEEPIYYETFGISIIVKAENINHAYMKFWETIINDKDINLSDWDADPLFENDHFSNWVIDSYDDKHITYKRPDKLFKIRVEELDLSKGYALAGDWHT